MERDIERMRKQMEKIEVPSKHELRLKMHDDIDTRLVLKIDGLIGELKAMKKHIKAMVAEFNAQKLTEFTEEIKRLGRELDETKLQRSSNLKRHVQRYHDAAGPKHDPDLEY